MTQNRTLRIKISRIPENVLQFQVKQSKKVKGYSAQIDRQIFLLL